MSGGPAAEWRPRLRSSIVLRHDRTRGSDVLLLPERVVVLHGSARPVLDLCDGTRTVDEISARLAEGHPAKTVRRDVEAFLNRMRTEGWLQ
ncbi:pyrroloquinoline quinone biosynthesis peptide chaperone PqqD [Streptomyces sp. PA03-5A]|nr:pyrroloquinoline quinone biosynthesis peptide chaperone PqqD [Streptomyces sp. PA03-5A]